MPLWKHARSKSQSGFKINYNTGSGARKKNYFRSATLMVTLRKHGSIFCHSLPPSGTISQLCYTVLLTHNFFSFTSRPFPPPLLSSFWLLFYSFTLHFPFFLLSFGFLLFLFYFLFFASFVSNFFLCMAFTLFSTYCTSNVMYK